MRLRDFLKYDNIVIQCHDNPDADAIASGFGVYWYFREQGKQVRFVYSGRNLIQKSNLVLMVSELQIPIEYVENIEKPDLLINVDCQYGEGNVTRFEAKEVAVIDHHQVSVTLPKLNDVRSNLGSCSTVVKELLEEEGIDVNSDKMLATALYYGLMTDTNNFTEISHPLDKDLRDDVLFERSMIVRFRNANLSLKELEIAGLALIGYDYNEQYRYAVVEAKPCDPNILGIISDLVLAVDSVETCLVYSVMPFGVKLSVRSCVKEVKASELAEFITAGIGSGGGHLEKAGGFIQKELLDKAYPQIDDMKAFFKCRMNDYFRDIVIIYAKAYAIDISGMQEYIKQKLKSGYVEGTDIFPAGTKITVRTLEGDLDVEIQDNLYVMIGIHGEIYPNTKEKFEKSYKRLSEPYIFEGEYQPTVKDSMDGKSISIVPYAKTCISTGDVYVYAKQLEHRVKVFTAWDDEKYMLGKEGDYLAVRKDDMHDIYIIEKNIFQKTYKNIDDSQI